MSNKFIAAVLMLSVFTITQTVAQMQNNTITPVKKGYAPVNGLNMYYEIYGEGKPLILLHGSFMTINMNWSSLLPRLAKNRKVIAIEFQGHGRTADIDRPYTIEGFADDVASALKFLQIDNTDLLGYSLGGTVALQVAIKNPQLIHKLIIISSPFKTDGWSKETRAVFPMIKPEFFERTPIKKNYDSLAPDPKHWPVFIKKMVKLVTGTYDFTEGVKTIKAPVLLILGDSDGILPEHTAEMFRLLGGGKNGDMAGVSKNQLAILPGTSHTGLMMRTDWLLSLVPTFLDGK